MTENAYLVWSTFFPPFFKLWPTINQLRTILLWIVEANFGEALRLVFSLSSSMLKFHRIKVIIKVNISMPLLFFKKKYDCFCLTNKTTGSSSSKWAYWNILWKLWWKLQQRWILDRLWYLWVVVPWKVYYDDPYKGWDPKAL